MSRAHRRQLTIGEWIGEWPVFEARGAWITIGDWRTCKRPEVGEIVIAVYAVEGEKPSRLEVLGKGTQRTIGKYTSAADRRALLSGERMINP